jgi:hypothetical protein
MIKNNSQINLTPGAFSKRNPSNSVYRVITPENNKVTNIYSHS